MSSYRPPPSSGFISVPPPPASTSDDHSYFPPVPLNPSPFARPEAPTDVTESNFNWSDNASTIHPDDSVSQLGRRMTGQGRRVGGPRGMPSVGGPSGLGNEVVVEEKEEKENYGWVQPESLEEEKSTIVPHQPLYNVPPSPSPYAPPPQDPYGVELDDDDDYHPNSTRDRSNSSANLPLVASAAPVAGYTSPSLPPSLTPGQSRAGYAAVGPDEEDPYSAYHNDREIRPDLGGGGGGGGEKGQGGLLGYVKSLTYRGGPTDQFHQPQHTYPPDSLKLEAGPPSSEEDISNLSPAPYWQRCFWDTTPIPLRKWEHKHGVGIQRWPVACWVLSIVMVVVMVVELVRMRNVTGSAIQTKPSFNVMIGPSGAVLINLGARFAGCMKFIEDVSDINWTCLNATNSATISASDVTCTMSDICGFGGFPTATPDQTFRFVVPIFLHAGVVHILLNLLAQLVSSAQIERMMGTPKFLLLYFAAGIFGFVLGANFALVGQPSVGASGAIFGTHAAILVDLIAHWNIEYQPKRKLFYLILEIVVGLGLGLVPGVDNFAHIGGFAVGLLVSMAVFPIIYQSKRHTIIVTILRVLALPLILVLFIVLIKNFYTTDSQKACSWCRYLSCWPTSGNNHCKGTGLQQISTTGSNYLASILTLVLTNFVVPFLVGINRISQFVPQTYTNDGASCSSLSGYSGQGCAGDPMGSFNTPGVVRVSGISKAYTECTDGAFRAYQCCQFQAGTTVASTAPSSSDTTTCGAQYRIDIQHCNDVGDNTACSATDLASNLNTCCQGTYTTISEGLEGPACQYGTQLRAKKMKRTSLSARPEHANRGL